MNSPLKEPPTMAYPRTLLSIAVSVGGLAMFLILASSFLVSQPIGSTVHEYFYGVDHSRKYDPTTLVNETDDLGKFEAKALVNENADSRTSVVNETANSSKFTSSAVVKETAGSVEDDSTYLVKDPVDADLSKGDSTSLIKKTVDLKKEDSTSIVGDNNNRIKDDTTSLVKGRIDMRKDNSTSVVKKAAVSGCDLYQGQWVYDSSGPLYSNDSCPILTQTQNCQGNGRPDKDYENWRWKPAQCDVPRFDPKKFLELMRGKTLAFVGDSVARNQMESMMCILWQFEVPRSRGNKRMQRYIFQSTSTTIVRIWSSWLVHVTSGATNFAPAGVDKLHLDVPDETFMELVLNYDVLVLSSGHWFAKKSVYMLNNEVVGGQLWKPQNLEQMKINSIEAFGISVETILTAMVTNPNYKGLTIVRTYSPDHYQGGAWDTGGSCTDKVRPASGDELVDNLYTKVMHDKQVGSFERAIKKKTNKSKLVLMDITQAFQYRHDGHPGPYRSPDSNKVTKRGPDGKPPPQDCLHWCMPGPVDIWNELVLEIIRREFENS